MPNYSALKYKVSLVRDAEFIIDRTSDTPGEAYSLAKDVIGFTSIEHLVVIALDSENKIIGVNTSSTGTIDSCKFSNVEILRFAILSCATAIIIAHNHPSGDPAPSNEDIDATKKIKEGCDAIGIKLLDHIILGHDRFVSMNRYGWM